MKKVNQNYWHSARSSFHLIALDNKKWKFQFTYDFIIFGKWAFVKLTKNGVELYLSCRPMNYFQWKTQLNGKKLDRQTKNHYMILANCDWPYRSKTFKKVGGIAPSLNLVGGAWGHVPPLLLLPAPLSIGSMMALVHSFGHFCSAVCMYFVGQFLDHV